jgi:hypothetical protein
MEIAMCDATSTVTGRERVTSETRQRGAVIERGLLIGGESVPASSGELADDVSAPPLRHAPSTPTSDRSNKEKGEPP